MGSSRKRKEVRVPIPLLSDELPGDPAANGERKKPLAPEVHVERCQKLIEEALDRVHGAWARVEEGAPLLVARGDIVKATTALIGLKRELSELQELQKKKP
jgi:hypothetical protein